MIGEAESGTNHVAGAESEPTPEEKALVRSLNQLAEAFNDGDLDGMGRVLNQISASDLSAVLAPYNMSKSDLRNVLELLFSPSKIDQPSIIRSNIAGTTREYVMRGFGALRDARQFSSLAQWIHALQSGTILFESGNSEVPLTQDLEQASEVIKSIDARLATQLSGKIADYTSERSIDFKVGATVPDQEVVEEFVLQYSRAQSERFKAKAKEIFLRLLNQLNTTLKGVENRLFMTGKLDMDDFVDNLMAKIDFQVKELELGNITSFAVRLEVSSLQFPLPVETAQNELIKKSQALTRPEDGVVVDVQVYPLVA